ncbi:hypothetical protein KC19_2G124100 [Ceratodon purpureus]|uniref:Uncharacterized protein n=1 Tax=Ceratodon purpureus TaxID=3225 RepID=A0A8T0IVN3_CERPU|nr:hypothetical protein KC19_2G124100 [Ceratodon purpureus]
MWFLILHIPFRAQTLFPCCNAMTALPPRDAYENITT